jgi:prepilin-type N-terminal cleavage/methylation domain-containing protein
MVRRRRARGFTIIELLVSMALATIGLLGLLALQVTATRGNANSREFIEAVGIAQERIEAVEVAPYNTISQLAEGTCTQPITGGSTVTINGSATAYWPTTYTRCTMVKGNADGLTTNVKVVVQWTDYTNIAGWNHYVTLETTRSP